MKNLAITLMCITTLGMNAAIHAQESEQQNGQANVIQETESHNVFEGLFLNIWSKLKSLNPTLKQSAKSTTVYTAGIRGAETTDTLLKPYWKDDLTQDEAFQAELEQFSKAQQKLDSGELDAAAKEFDQFLNQYSDSALRPNALFARGMSLAGIGKNESSIASMQLFIDENPNHPLVGDAELVIEALSG
jgi:TolA-binding protein